MRACALSLFLCLGSAAAAPFAVQVGEARLGLDAPPGFADTGFTGSPRLQELAESLTSPSNRILLFALTDGDLRKFSLGDRPEFRRYMIAATPKEIERERLSAQRFADLVVAALRDFGEPPPAGKSLTEHFDQQPPGKPVALAELRRDAQVASVLLGARLEPLARGQKPRYMVSTSTLMLLRGKAVSLGVFGAYEGPADLEWIRAITARWIDDLQRLNNR